MRPVQRPAYTGPVVTRYQAYLEPLVEALGPYCSYCEILDKLDVEHVVPTSHSPDQKLNWDNLLLGCPRCNRDFKNNDNESRDGHLWPDLDDTFHAFTYFPDGRVKVAEGLEEQTKTKAQALITLICLDDSAQPHPARNLARRTAFRVASHAKRRYIDGHQTLDEVLVQAEQGYWSVWMTVFRDLPEVRRRLLEHPSYPGTAVDRLSFKVVEEAAATA